MKPLHYATTAGTHAYMRGRQAENKAASACNQNENWFAAKLNETAEKWTRQTQWGYRLFDFWCHELGIAVEIDGREHDPRYDGYRDKYNYLRSGIVVLHVRNRNEEDAARALEFIAKSESWAARRHRLGLDQPTKKSRRRAAEEASNQPWVPSPSPKLPDTDRLPLFEREGLWNTPSR